MTLDGKDHVQFMPNEPDKTVKALWRKHRRTLPEPCKPR